MITLKDLSKKLDVSVSTVSKALNDSPEISEETIRRVQALAKYYNYTPNQSAINLKNRETKTIGVIVPNILNRFFATVLYSIQENASKLGYNIIICNSNESIQKEKDSFKILSNGSVDGFIIAVSEETQKQKNYTHIEALENEKIPFLMFDRVLENINCDKVIIDDSKAVADAVNVLFQKGKKHVAFISTISELNVGKLREKGYKKALEENQSKPNTYILNIAKNKDSHVQISNFLSQNPEIDAIISADNISGTQALNIALSVGYKIPKDISIIGFSDEAISSLSVPKLSVIDQNALKMGEVAVKQLYKRLKNKNKPVPFSTKIIETNFNCNGSD